MIASILCLALVGLSVPRADFACQQLETVLEASELYNISPQLLVAVIYVESRWNHEAVSRSNACGLTQVLPKYTKKPKLSCKDLFDPRLSIMTGAKKLNYWIYKYGKGNKEIGLCGYNAGYRCRGKDRHKRGIRYARKVLRYSKKVSRKYKEFNSDS